MGNSKIKLFFLPAVLLLVVFACSLPSPQNVNNMLPSQPVTNTAPVIPTATTQLPTATVIVISATATAAATLTPTIAYTPTSSIPMVTVSVGTNCREGPGRIYNLLDGLMVGEQAEIVRLAPAGVNYVVIKRPHEPGECWLWLEYATITGDISRLPIAVIPPTPTATATPTMTITATSTSTQTFTPTTPAPAPFAGSWTMIVAGSSPTVNITQTGNIISGSFKMAGGNIVTFNGTLSSDNQTVTGTFTQSAGDAGDFVWHVFNNLMQFNGHGVANSVTFEWCGYRAGQSAPVPCLAP